jgi:hypothetical protein
MMSGCHPLSPLSPLSHSTAPESGELLEDIRQAFPAMQKWVGYRVRYRPAKLRASTPPSSPFSPIGRVART